MRFILNWLVAAVVIMVAAYLLPGITVAGWGTALVLALVLGAINAFVKPIVVMLTMPLTMLTLGLFLFVINAFLIMLAGFIVPGFAVASFWWALLFSVVLSVFTSVVHMMGAPTVPQQ